MKYGILNFNAKNNPERQNVMQKRFRDETYHHDTFIMSVYPAGFDFFPIKPVKCIPEPDEFLMDKFITCCYGSRVIETQVKLFFNRSRKVRASLPGIITDRA